MVSMGTVGTDHGDIISELKPYFISAHFLLLHVCCDRDMFVSIVWCCVIQ